MKRLVIGVAASVAVIGVFAGQAMAVAPHLKGRNPVVLVDNGLTLTATVSYAGLGNFDTLQQLDATGSPLATCSNNGQHQAPGQNPAEADVSGSTAVPADDIKNGNVSITTVTDPPETPIEGAPDCPNPNWTEDITDMAFTSATIRLFQDSNENDIFDPGELVLTVNCTFDPATSNGPVPASGFTCTEA
jgi:hypothetical protein